MKTYLFEDVVCTKTSMSNIWYVITDFENWPDWDNSIEYIKLNSYLAQGSVGYIKFRKTSEFDFEILKLKENQILILKIKTLVGHMELIYSLVEVDGDCYINKILEFKGFFSYFYFKLYGLKLCKNFQSDLKHLSDRAKKLN